MENFTKTDDFKVMMCCCQAVCMKTVPFFTHYDT